MPYIEQDKHGKRGDDPGNKKTFHLYGHISSYKVINSINGYTKKYTK